MRYQTRQRKRQRLCRRIVFVAHLKSIGGLNHKASELFARYVVERGGCIMPVSLSRAVVEILRKERW